MHHVGKQREFATVKFSSLSILTNNRRGWLQIPLPG